MFYILFSKVLPNWQEAFPAPCQFVTPGWYLADEAAYVFRIRHPVSQCFCYLLYSPVSLPLGSHNKRLISSHQFSHICFRYRWAATNASSPAVCACSCGNRNNAIPSTEVMIKRNPNIRVNVI